MAGECKTSEFKFKLPEFSPPACAPCYTGLFEMKATPLAPYDDGLAWLYRQGTAGALIAGELPLGFAAHTIARCYGAFAGMESFFDDRPYPYGAWFFDIQRPPAYLDGKGKLDNYSSTSKCFYGSRGTQFAWLAAAILPELKSHPALWENARKRNAGDILVRMVDDPPVTDGVKDPIYNTATPLGDDSAKVTLVSDPRNLHVFIETTRPQLMITFQEETGESRVAAMSEDPGEGTALRESDERDSSHLARKKSKHSAPKEGGTSHKKSSASGEKSEPPAATAFTHGGKLTVTHEGVCTVVNEKGEPLLETSVFKQAAFKQGEGDGWIVEVRIPYTFVPAQNTWINGVDFGRYRVGIDAAPPQTVCILSDASRIQKRLENGVLGTIDFWSKVWQERGFIPSGWHSPTTPAGAWEVSDAGGYAHLIQAMAFWLIYQDGRREWEIIREEFPSTPKPAPPLPASVLKAQGLQ